MVLGLATSVRVVVLVVEGFGGIEDAGAAGNGVVIVGVGREDSGT